MCNLNNKANSTIKLLNLDSFKGTPAFVLQIYQNSKCHISAHIWDIENFSFSFPGIVLSKPIEKIGRFKSLKFTYEWRQQMWRHNLTFGVIIWAVLIGLMFRIFRPSLVGKELKQAKIFQINRNFHVLISSLGVVWPHHVSKKSQK